MKEPTGGVESAVMAYVRRFDRSLITVDAAVFESDFSYREEIEAMGGRVFVLPVRRSDPKGYNTAVQKLFTENSYDAVWCNFSGLTNIDFLKLAKEHGVKKRLAHSHTTALAWGSAVMKYAVISLHTKNRLVIDRYATDFRGCSKRSALFMFGEKNGRNAKVIPNAIESGKFAFSEEKRNSVREEFSIPADAFVLGHVGRMCFAKNQKFLLDIFEKLCERNDKARLLFVGDGELKDEITAYAKTLKCCDKIVFTGSRTDTDRLYSAMDTFCLPSDNEGFPVTLVEAQAASLPCVVSAQAVDKDADICGNMSFLSITESADKWADEAIRVFREKKAAAKAVADSDYDIDRAAASLQAYFTGR